MNESTLQGFRDIAAIMAGPEPQDWQWIGPHMSQRMFGITETRAKDYAQRHGGAAKPMNDDGEISDYGVNAGSHIDPADLA